MKHDPASAIVPLACVGLLAFALWFAIERHDHVHVEDADTVEQRALAAREPIVVRQGRQDVLVYRSSPMADSAVGGDDGRNE